MSWIFSHPNYIDVHVEDDANNMWRFTGMYREFNVRTNTKHGIEASMGCHG
jgi:hypothetical protein